jgi:hypothetical protein
VIHAVVRLLGVEPGQRIRRRVDQRLVADRVVRDQRGLAALGEQAGGVGQPGIDVEHPGRAAMTRPRRPARAHRALSVGLGGKAPRRPISKVSADTSRVPR